MPNCVALVPARSGSKRVPDKNVRFLQGHPLLAYSVSSALDSNVFDAVYCATDSADYAEIARHYGAEVPALRDPAISGDKSPDIEWVGWMLAQLEAQGVRPDCFSILRPTSPFRQASTIRRAWQSFLADQGADSIRAIEKCAQHPGKMWVIRGGRMQPILPYHNGDTPWHSSQYAALPEIWVQNASLEIAWTRVVRDQGSIAGDSIVPFVSEGFEGFDINHPEDWMLAEHYIAAGVAQLPVIGQRPWQPKN